jgi:hypothetical protein
MQSSHDSFEQYGHIWALLVFEEHRMHVRIYIAWSVLLALCYRQSRLIFYEKVFKAYCIKYNCNWDQASEIGLGGLQGKT